MKKYGPTILFVVLTAFTTPSHVRSQPEDPKDRYPKIAGSTILADLQSLKNSDPTITPSEIAKRGNQMIAQKGITYVFDVCEFLAQNGKRLREVENEFSQPYSVRLTTIEGRTREFEIAASEPFQGAGCFVKIAALRVTPAEMTVIAEGKPVTLVRPKGFRLPKLTSSTAP